MHLGYQTHNSEITKKLKFQFCSSDPDRFYSWFKKRWVSDNDIISSIKVQLDFNLDTNQVGLIEVQSIELES